MSQQAQDSKQQAPPGTPGGGLREQVELAGAALAEAFGGLLGELSGRHLGPQALADLLGITIVTASRLLKAIGQADPIAVVEQIPGTVPLRRIVDAAIEKGAPKGRTRAALAAVEAFEQLIRKNAGHRSGLNAMLTDWLPQSRREFEARRRQSAYKAISELRGVSCELDLATLVLWPSEQAGMLDLLSIQGYFGLDRIRPDSVVQFGTLRAPGSDAEQVKQSGVSTTPGPSNLDGQAAVDGLHSVRLDQFCSLSPAPLETARFGRNIQYTLGQTGFGPDSSVDFVIAEVNRGELRIRPLDEESNRPYFFQVLATPAKTMVFDLLIHRDIYPDAEPELLVYDTSIHGPARAGTPQRKVDLIRVSEEIESLGYRPSRRRFSGFPRYLELLEHSFEKLKLDGGDFRAYRLQMTYPLHGMQVCMALQAKGSE